MANQKKSETIRVKITHSGIHVDGKPIDIGTEMGITPAQEIGWCNKFTKIEQGKKEDRKSEKKEATKATE